MVAQVFVGRKLSFLVTAGAMLLFLALSVMFAQSASAHGNVIDSRATLCAEGVNTDCGPVQYEPFSVEGRGDFPEYGVPDGQIAGGTVFPALDEQTSERWAKVDISGGTHTFEWNIVANHSTNRWDYYITKKGWDPNSELARADLELFCTYDDHGEQPPNTVTHDCFIPNDRAGYYVIVAVWDIEDTENAFYQVIDANLSIDESQPANPEPGFPGDPDRYGDIPEWHPVQAYTAGDVVTHNGQLWEAKWWTKGQEPGTTGENGPWQLAEEQ